MNEKQKSFVTQEWSNWCEKCYGMTFNQIIRHFTDKEGKRIYNLRCRVCENDKIIVIPKDE